MAYESKQAILEEAGFSYLQQAEAASGVVDGSNRIFTVANGPLSDGNYDDSVTIADVVAYINDLPVTVASVDANARAITLTSAPTPGAVVTIDYRYSPVSDASITRVREEAQDLIDQAMDGIDPVPYTAVPLTVRKMVRVYAAGLLLTRDYGFNRDTENTSKDGYMKLGLVEGRNGKPGWLDKWVERGGLTGSSAEDDDAQIITEPPLFSQFDQTTQRYTHDSEFMQGRVFETEGDDLP